MRINISLLILVALLPIALFPGESPLRAGDWSDCRGDWQQLCAGISDQYSVFQCLQREERKLAPQCRSHLAKEHARIRSGARENCGRDYARFCWHVIPGDGRIFRCLKSHLPELSPACRAQFESLPEISGAG